MGGLPGSQETDLRPTTTYALVERGGPLSKKLLGLLVAGSLIAPSGALAAPVTVQLRVEGPTKTVFEGPVTTDVRTFRFTTSPTQYECDNGLNAGGTGVLGVVRNNALNAAAEQAGFALEGTFSSFGPTFTRVGDQAVAYDAGTGRYLVEYLDAKASGFGGCSDPIKDGSDVLYAYGTGSEPLLKLTGPATAQPGQSVAVKVTDAAGAPVAGATVGGATTAADGTAAVGPLAAGPTVLKAQKAGAIRSNGLAVCATTGSDGACGTAVPAGGTTVPAATSVSGTASSLTLADHLAPSARIAGLTWGQRFSGTRAPRLLRGTVSADASGLQEVRIRLTRTDGPRCSTFDPVRERFVTTRRCGAAAGKLFKVGEQSTWSYQLPARLGRGRYVLDVVAIDRAGNADVKAERNRNRVVFRVA